MEAKPDKPAPTPAPKENKLDWRCWLLAIGPPLSIAAPVICILMILYLGGVGTVFLVLSIICFVLTILSIFLLQRLFRKPPPPMKGSYTPSEDDGPDPGSTLFLGMLGGYLLGRSSRKKSNSFFSDSSEDFLWQEKYRRHDN